MVIKLHICKQCRKTFIESNTFENHSCVAEGIKHLQSMTSEELRNWKQQVMGDSLV